MVDLRKKTRRKEQAWCSGASLYWQALLESLFLSLTSLYRASGVHSILSPVSHTEVAPKSWPHIGLDLDIRFCENEIDQL